MSKEIKLLPELRFHDFEKDGEWIKTKLGDAADFINGRAYSQKELLSEGKYRVLRVGNFFTNNEWYYSDLELDEDKYCDNGDLLYAWSASFGPRIWKEEKVIYHYHIWKVKNKEGINRQFLFYLLDYETFRMKSKTLNGFALMHITKGTIENWKSIIPKFEIEQQKIASCLSSLDELIAAHADKLDALKDHKKGLIQNLFPPAGKAVPKVRFPEFEDNGEWVEMSIGSIAKVSAGGTPTSTELKYWGGNIPWMNSGELNLKRIYSVENNITDLGLKESSTKKIPSLCVLIGLAGQGKTRGTAAINYIELCTNQSIAAIHPNKKKFDSEFLFHKIDSMYKTLRGLSTGQGGRGGLNLSIIREIEIPLPCIEEQKKIASCLSAVDDLITAQAEKIEELQQHKKGLMQGLFPKTES